MNDLDQTVEWLLREQRAQHAALVRARAATVKGGSDAQTRAAREALLAAADAIMCTEFDPELGEGYAQDD
jgi:hypothetical protein